MKNILLSREAILKELRALTSNNKNTKAYKIECCCYLLQLRLNGLVVIELLS